MSLRDELLRLLKEDEEFRLAVVGLLGITDVQATLKRLMDVVTKLADNQATMLTTLNSVLTALGGLVDTMQKLLQEVKVLREDQAKLWQEVRSLREGQEALRKGQEALWREVRGIRRDLRDVKSTLEKYSITTEEEANDTVQYYLRQRGVVVETKPTFLNSGYEFDIYGTNGAVTIVGEAKVRAGPRTVERVNGKIEEAIKAMPNKFPGKIIKVLYCLRASPNTLEAANKYGIWLLESGKERNTPPLP